MLDSILNIFRRRRVRKFISDVPTGFLPLERISTVNAVIDVEDPGYDLLKDDIFAWGKANGLKVNIYFFDFRKLGKDDLLLTSIQTTIIRKELDWLGMPSFSKIGHLIEEPSDLFISMINNGDFPIEFLSKCVKAKFKVGRFGFAGDAYDMIIKSSPMDDMRSESSQVFATITEFINKIR